MNIGSKVKYVGYPGIVFEVISEMTQFGTVRLKQVDRDFYKVAGVENCSLIDPIAKSKDNNNIEAGDIVMRLNRPVEETYIVTFVNKDIYKIVSTDISEDPFNVHKFVIKKIDKRYFHVD